MNYKIALLLAMVWILPLQSLAVENDRAYTICPALSDDRERLACYDSYASASGGEGESLFGYGIDGLTSHEPNKLLARTDDNDESQFYMDATVSMKYPVFTPLVEGIADVLAIDRERNTPRLYLAFTTRFSQYVGSRKSSPMVPRRYNPELFFRVWRDGVYERTNPSYWDFGYGHESNGQSVADAATFELARETARLSGGSSSRAWPSPSSC